MKMKIKKAESCSHFYSCRKKEKEKAKRETTA